MGESGVLHKHRWTWITFFFCAESGGTATQYGLQFGFDIIKTYGRDISKKYILVMTDGYSNDEQRTCEKAAEIKASGKFKR